jgi:hypothetical protein
MSRQQDGSKVLTIEANSVEFVLNNGANDWDTPNPYGLKDKPKNYVVRSPGSYRLRSGKLERL